MSKQQQSFKIPSEKKAIPQSFGVHLNGGRMQKANCGDHKGAPLA